QVVFGEINKIQQIPKNQNARGIINFGASEAISNYLLSEPLNRVQRKLPNVHFNIYTATQSHLLDMISKGQLDFGLFFYTPKLPGNLEISEEKPYRHHLVVKSDKQKNTATLCRFLGSREIDDVETHKFPTLEYLRQHHPEAQIVFSSNSLSLHKQLVLKGQGVSVLPRFMIESELRRKSLVDIFPNKKFEWNLKLVQRKSELIAPAGREFLTEVF
ncbi:MAG: substrate-binding domain-containing protein, partial [Bdellovibrionales bacterium]|nr:substrate-binding domain-containing protein [Bdellovibrionales bacterium]